MNMTSAIAAYNDVGIETSVLGADPHQLVSMLYEGALLAISKAGHAMLEKNTAAKGLSISKAIAIVGEGLHASLDKNVGGELALNLSRLYDYMVARLVHANLNNDAQALDEVSHLLGELKEAWDAIRPRATRAAARPEDAATVRRHAHA